jgi:hypothetical protein
MLMLPLAKLLTEKAGGISSRIDFAQQVPAFLRAWTLMAICAFALSRHAA